MNEQTTPTIDLINKLGFIDKRLKQIEFEKEALKTEYNLTIQELWNRVPLLENTNEFQPKILRKKK